MFKPPSNHNFSASFDAVLAERVSRRQLLTSAAAAGAVGLATTSWGANMAAGTTTRASAAPLQGIAPQTGDALVLAAGYRHSLLARWGDPLQRGDAGLRTAALRTNDWLDDSAVDAQQQRFGTNCDALAYFPLRRTRRNQDIQGYLCVNHEYVNAELVFADYAGGRRSSMNAVEARRAWTLAQPHSVAWMQAAHGVTVMQVRRGMRGWSTIPGAVGTRRITANTPCDLSGPARGHPLLATAADPRATTVLGTFANCAGGKTPWGTYLTAEENIDDYFGRGASMLASTADGALVEAYRRIPPPQHSIYGWEYLDPRFDLQRNPQEMLRHGWIVEIDPLSPDDPPRKRTALGRFKHEGANTRIAPDGRVAAYMGDDEIFEYVYKFVTRDAFDPGDRAHNRDLLDHGTLYVARFDADGTGAWLPLVHDENGPLNSRAGFHNQGDVVIKARGAADLLGATPMDRPEDIEPSPLTGRVYIACTKNAEREANETLTLLSGRYLELAANTANPRPDNRSGQVIELIETADDPTATSFSWHVFLLAGDPATGRFLTDAATLAAGSLAATDTYFAGYAERADVSRLHCPDNLGFDPSGRLWIVTDSDGKDWPNNGCYVVPTEGAERGRLRQLMSAPTGSEVCGCEFTPDGRTLFLSIQHPGEGGTLEQPVSDWPDRGGLPPRAAVIAIERDDGRSV